MAALHHLTHHLDAISLTPDPPATPEDILQRLITLAKHLNPGLPTTAIHVTLQLARSYAPGGLLVLLQQPRDYHPWHRGTDSVIAGCPTLQFIEDATTHYYGHGLRGQVSLLDLWFCLPPSITDPLLDEQSPILQEMEDLVMAYIQAKRPTCILCMGARATFAIERTRESSSAPFWRDVSVIFACHPSRSIRHASDDVQMRTSLLRKIQTACAIATPNTQATLASPLTVVGCEFQLINFMELLLCCCFEIKHRLPSKSLTRGTCCFTLERWHINWFRDMSQRMDHLSRARARLIPVFHALNSAIRTSSWILSTYELNRPSIIQTLTRYFSMVEADCCLIATYQLHHPAPTKPRDLVLTDEDGVGGFMRHICQINAQNLGPWQDMGTQIPRRSTWLGGLADE